MPVLEIVTRIPAPPERCFELSLSVDAHTASMAGSGERIVGGVRSGAMGLGDEVTWRARHFGIPFTMTSRITAYDAAHRFVDEQVRGPFGRWWHEHRFTEAPGGTEVVDLVEFSSPLGPLGRAVDVLVLTRYIARLLEQRNRWLVAELADEQG
ncbi:SRPBCC family protein [Nocardioides sp. zg-536]|uniref:SRPBCC family protein n=1 Tax=Nocardioides faecalis TaxID=2803858 RepID=A0A939BXR9_9ACTN|nr:SRPBCC family protein [Nocardioides faecalis]MBM9459583.1 SRPBCC family protein [Nocardioides faecalis]QVI58109.1 SRPBCC family protein [Nocardioides faecalis]